MFAFIKNNKIDFISPFPEKPENYDGEVVEYADEIINPEFIDGTIRGKKIDGQIEKRMEKINEFLSVASIDNFNWDGVEITTDEYNSLIVMRNFSGDTGSQIAMLTKSTFKILALLINMGLTKNTVKAVFAEELAVIEKISETRVALGLAPFDLSFLQ